MHLSNHALHTTLSTYLPQGSLGNEQNYSKVLARGVGVNKLSILVKFTPKGIPEDHNLPKRCTTQLHACASESQKQFQRTRKAVQFLCKQSSSLEHGLVPLKKYCKAEVFMFCSDYCSQPACLPASQLTPLPTPPRHPPFKKRGLRNVPNI